MQILSGRKGTSCCMTGCLSTESTTILEQNVLIITEEDLSWDRETIRAYLEQLHIQLEEEKLVVAEGNVGDTNCSGVVRREKDEHIRAIIRIPDGFTYE